MTLLAIRAARRALLRSWERRDVVFEHQHTRMVTWADVNELDYYSPPVVVRWAPEFA